MMIMMVITPITSRGLPAAVPEAAKNSQPAEQPLVLRLDRDANLWLNRERVPERDFEARLTHLRALRSDAVLFIDADPELAFASVAHLIDRVRGLGFSRAALIPRTAH